jgi:alkylated DNA repair protein (DNA oxidative demethylase)
LAAAIGAVLAEAPPFTPRMPRTGKPFSVRMSNCGPLGWVSDRQGGYRYQPTHPETGAPWPAMPAPLLQLWQEHAGYPAPPEACLINIYEADAKMGLHRDEDEEDFAAPVLSVSLGDDCLFRIGGRSRGGATRSVRLHSGDIIVLGGESRLAYHGVDRIYPGTTPPGFDLPAGARINLTLRRVTKPAVPKGGR